MSGNSFAGAGSQSDPILTWLQKIRFAYDQYLCNPTGLPRECLLGLTRNCINLYCEDSRYKDDERFLKVFIIHADASKEFTESFKQLEKYDICQDRAVFYICLAMFHIGGRDLVQANEIYKKGIARKAKPLENLMNSYTMFRKHVHRLALKNSPLVSAKIKAGEYIDPFSVETVQYLLKVSDIQKQNGYFKINADAWLNVSMNTIIELGGQRFLIEETLGSGGYATVYKAHNTDNPNNVCALKVERKKSFAPFIGPWEFYMYCQLHSRIPRNERSSFAAAHGLFVYNDCTILVTDYFSQGSFWDVIESYYQEGKVMPELVCLYYTIEMVHILEVLHDAHILHGDFKSDNLLVRYARDKLTVEGFKDKTGPWQDQGLCLIDWGKGIDLNKFPTNTEFYGDCVAKEYKCIEMQEERPWTYQIDSYAICVNVYYILRSVYMEVDVGYDLERDKSYYLPKEGWKSEWHDLLWSLFYNLLNIKSNKSDVALLGGLKARIQKYICSDPQLISKLICQLEEEKRYLEKWMNNPMRVKAVLGLPSQETTQSE